MSSRVVTAKGFVPRYASRFPDKLFKLWEAKRHGESIEIGGMHQSCKRLEVQRAVENEPRDWFFILAEAFFLNNG